MMMRKSRQISMPLSGPKKSLLLRSGQGGLRMRQTIKSPRMGRQLSQLRQIVFMASIISSI